MLKARKAFELEVSKRHPVIQANRMISYTSDEGAEARVTQTDSSRFKGAYTTKDEPSPSRMYLKGSWKGPK